MQARGRLVCSPEPLLAHHTGIHGFQPILSSASLSSIPPLPTQNNFTLPYEFLMSVIGPPSIQRLGILALTLEGRGKVGRGWKCWLVRDRGWLEYHMRGVWALVCLSDILAVPGCP